MKRARAVSPALGVGFALLTALVTSFGFVAAKPVLAFLDPLSFSISQFALATIFSFLWLAAYRDTHRIKSLTGPQWTFLWIIAAIFLAAVYCLWIALSIIPATSSALLHRLELLVAVFLGMAFLGERLARREALGGVVMLLGVLVLRFDAPPSFSRGFWMMVLSSSLFGLQEVLIKTQVHAIPPRVFAFMRNALAFVLFMVAGVWRVVMQEHAGWKGLVDWEGVWVGLPLITVVALVGPVLGRTTYMYSLYHLSVARASLILQAQPLFVGVLSSLILFTAPSRREVVGGLLILAGCLVLVQWKAPYRFIRRSSRKL